MSLSEFLHSALENAWNQFEAGNPGDFNLPNEIKSAVENILDNDSAPNRQMLLAIVAGTCADHTSDPTALQGSAGVDRRGQAYLVRDVLSQFRIEHGLMFKVSQDAGVSNQWREPQINSGWVERRRTQDRNWAAGFLTIANWLHTNPSDSAELLGFLCRELVELFSQNALDYPRFGASTRIAMELVYRFIQTAPDRPDATEAVIAAATRILATTYGSSTIVERTDINSPDPIDIRITSDDGEVNTGIEVTDSKITLSKLQHELIPAMTKLGLDKAIVVARTPSPDEVSRINEYLDRILQRLSLQVDIVEIGIVEAWLSAPGLPYSLSTEFLWKIGDELDQFSKEGNRRAWLNVLNNYVQEQN